MNAMNWMWAHCVHAKDTGETWQKRRQERMKEHTEKSLATLLADQDFSNYYFFHGIDGECECHKYEIRALPVCNGH